MLSLEVLVYHKNNGMLRFSYKMFQYVLCLCVKLVLYKRFNKFFCKYQAELLKYWMLYGTKWKLLMKWICSLK